MNYHELSPKKEIKLKDEISAQQQQQQQQQQQLCIFQPNESNHQQKIQLFMRSTTATISNVTLNLSLIPVIQRKNDKTSITTNNKLTTISNKNNK